MMMCCQKHTEIKIRGKSKALRAIGEPFLLHKTRKRSVHVNDTNRIAYVTLRFFAFRDPFVILEDAKGQIFK